MEKGYLAERIGFASLGIIAVLALNGCGDECKEYSNYSCKQLEKATYNAYFSFPDGNKEYTLGLPKA